MLTIDKIHVNYGSFQALDGVSLTVNEGEIVALLGSNGAGKTTTINTASGLLRPLSGSVLFEGQDLSKYKLHEISSLGLIQVPEGRKLFPDMTIHENLLVGSYAKGARARRAENLDMCYSMFPKLKERSKQLAGSLSGGERQMVAIARALMQCPKLLMLDEPSLGLAPVVVEQVFEIIQSINKMGTTILLVEQNVQVSLEIADRAYVIETGKNVMEGSAKELLSNEALKSAYLGM
ncbi:MAG: ABC transporter ATP-binding protein [Oscillospiraceae bacterium]|nr:ABC transporter ATP-binding protein [Oscillospiraceae bacterium]